MEDNCGFNKTQNEVKNKIFLQSKLDAGNMQYLEQISEKNEAQMINGFRAQFTKLDNTEAQAKVLLLFTDDVCYFKNVDTTIKLTESVQEKTKNFDPYILKEIVTKSISEYKEIELEIQALKN